MTQVSGPHWTREGVKTSCLVINEKDFHTPGVSDQMVLMKEEKVLRP